MNPEDIDHGIFSKLQREWTEEQRATVAKELDSLLSDPAFRHSGRCSSLLGGLVKRALEGNSHGVKERTLGVEIFGRQPSYDTNADPIVRMTANEIRKRLAQYYQQPGHGSTVQIRLVPGSYLPEFDFGLKDSPVLDTGPDAGAPEISESEIHRSQAMPLEEMEATTPLTASPLAEVAEVSTAQRSTPFLHQKWAWLTATFVLVIAAGLAPWASDYFRSTQYLIWKPLLNSKAALFFCISDNSLLQQGVGGTEGQKIADIIASRKLSSPTDSAGSAASVLLGDVIAIQGISVWLSQRGIPTTVRPSSALTLWEFRRQPAILIGSIDNPWSLVLLSNLRFAVRVDPASQTVWIQDSQNPNKRDWVEDPRKNADTHYDYAVITRFLNPETGTWIFDIGGLEPNGTMAASQFLTDPTCESLIPRAIRTAKNFQIVIRTNEISGKVSIPQVLAYHTW